MKAPLCRAQQGASVGVRDLSLAGAGRAFDGIDFAARLYRLHHDGKARSVASNARMFFDLRNHTGTFQAASLSELPSVYPDSAERGHPQPTGEMNHVAQRNQPGTMFSRDHGRRAMYRGVADREQGGKLFMGELFMGELPHGGSAADRHLRRSSPLARKHCDFLSVVVAVKMRMRPHDFMRDDPIGCTAYDVVAFTGCFL